MPTPQFSHEYKLRAVILFVLRESSQRVANYLPLRRQLSPYTLVQRTVLAVQIYAR